MAETLSDVIVNIDVEAPAAVVGFGNLLILTPATGETPTASYKEYDSLDDLKEDHADNTEVFGKARDFFAQANAATPVAVQTFVAGKVNEALDSCFEKNWHFAVFAKSGDIEIDDEADVLAAVKFIEAQKYKFLFLQVSSKEEVAPYAPVTNNGTVVQPGYKRTAVYVHAIAGENLEAAVIGDAASLTVGSITWKFRKDLAGITADTFTASEVRDIHAAGGNTYVVKAGVPQTTEGKTAAGEYIDALHGDDWVKANIETTVQQLLMNSDKLPYTQAGISQIAAAVEGVLSTAYVNGIVDTDPDSGNPMFSVTTVPIAQVSAEQKQKRSYEGTSFTYTRQSAIHEATISGVISTASEATTTTGSETP